MKDASQSGRGPEGAADRRCPVCGRGELVDIVYTGGSADRDVPMQRSDTRQVETYSCGHEREGPRLDESASPESGLDVERRSSGDTVDPPPGPS
jgi:hypothetical protein